VPVPEVIQRSDALLARLQHVGDDLASDGTISAARDRILAIDARLKRHVADVHELIWAGARVGALAPPERGLREARVDLQTLVDDLTKVATRLETALDELATERDSWKLTRKEATASGAPPATVERVDQTVVAIDAARKMLRDRRSKLLELQEQASGDLTLASATIEEIDTFRREFAGRLLQRDSQPIWRLDFSSVERERMVERFTAMLAAEYEDLRLLVPQASGRLALQGLLFAGLYLAFRTGRRSTKKWSEEDPGMETAATVFQSPIASALLLTIASTRVIQPQVPYMAGVLLGLIGLPTALHTLVPLVNAPLRPALYTLAAFFLVDRIRDTAEPVPELEQVLLAGELAIGLVLLLLLLRSGRLAGVKLAPEQIDRLRWLGRGVKLLTGLVAGALLCTLVGLMQLARLLGGGAFVIVYSGFAYLALARAFDGLVTFALRVRPLCHTRAVQVHRRLIEHRVQRATAWVAGALFVFTALGGLHLWAPTHRLVRELLAVEFVPGESKLSVGDVFAFGLILLGSYGVARFVCFALETDVYPRFHFGRGVPYAITTLTRYALFVAGFLLGVAALGIDLSKVTLLAGALGVGIGFGLQNIVNNFVSGLILLFERPIQVGDTVQLANLSGEVRRIGLRSSTLRTFDGAEVIVPNANLIQDAVTNWTLSDNSRRIEITVGVAYGTEPERVIALLHEVAGKQREVLRSPPPAALFVGFGPSSLDFVLRCWLVQSENWVTVRSELAIAVHDALRDAGIAIPFPQVELSLKPGSTGLAAGPPARPRE
jgi:small-conductance mechanosensitive channel